MWVMFRTRDFILVFTTVVFLLVAISATVWHSLLSTPFEALGIELVAETQSEHSAVIAESSEMTRGDRLASLKQKIGQGGVVISAAAVPEPALEETELVVTAPVEILGEQRCPLYSPYGGQWPSATLVFAVVEGSRIVYTETIPDVVSVDTSSTSIDVAPTSVRTVYAQLPVRSIPSLSISCVQSDVIGVAQDGSLIRNNEAGLYGVFGSDTLIGYALDGFPIYGSSGAPTDSCGGTVVAGQYRYQLSPDRDVIINCYSAAPTGI